jgi:hypothetical protein
MINTIPNIALWQIYNVGVYRKGRPYRNETTKQLSLMTKTETDANISDFHPNRRGRSHLRQL